MKYSKMLILAVVLLLSACGKQTMQSLSIKTSIDTQQTTNQDNSVQLEISAVDGNVIESVEIDIEVLNIHDNYDEIGEKKWELTKTLTIDEHITSGTHEIIVTVTDQNGVENTAISHLTVD